MINIDNISAGWADLHLGYCTFSVSYLSYLKMELDMLFDLEERDDESAVNKIILEGEGQGDLTLVAYLTYGDLNRFEEEYAEVEHAAKVLMSDEETKNELADLYIVACGIKRFSEPLFTIFL